MPDVFLRYNSKAVRGRQLKTTEKAIRHDVAEILELKVEEIAVQRIKAKGTGLLDIDVIVSSSTTVPTAGERQTNEKRFANELQSGRTWNPHKASDFEGVSEKFTAAAEPIRNAVSERVIEAGLDQPSTHDGKQVAGIKEVGVRTMVGVGEFNMAPIVAVDPGHGLAP